MSKNHNIEVIAEIANAHQGDPKKAVQIAIDAIKSGADAVKFQMYFADEFLTKNHPRFLHFKQQSFSKGDWKKIFTAIQPFKKKIYCDIFGEKALTFSEKFNLDGYKIHSSDILNFHLLDRLNRLCKNKKIFLSSGGSTLREIAKAISILYKKNELTLLYGFQNYPTKIEDLNLNNIIYLKKNFGKFCKIGYMDHTDAEDQINFYLPIFSIQLGAQVIEKHITYDRSKRGVDHHSSLNPDEFSKFVKLIKCKKKINRKFSKRLTTSLGHKGYLLTKKELEYRFEVKKSWVAKSNIRKNKIITKKDLIMKRSPENLVMPPLENLIGFRLIKSIKKDKVIQQSYLDYKVFALIIARTNSQRLSKKILRKIQGYTALEHIIKRLKKSKRINQIILSTTKKKSDDLLCKIAKKYGIGNVRGADKDVLSRMLLVSKKKPDIIVRVTGDDILVDPVYIDKAIDYHTKKNLEYCSINKIPKGTEIELFNFSLLKELYETLKNRNGTEYLTNIINDNIQNFNVSDLPVKFKHQKKIRLTLDTKYDLKVINYFLEEMNNKRMLFDYSMDSLLNFFKKRKDILKINESVKQKKIPKIFSTEIFWNKLIN